MAVVPVLLLPRTGALLLLGSAMACALVIEWVRRPGGWGRDRFLALVGGMLKPHERDRLSGATYLAIAYFLAVLIFPQPVAITAMFYGGLGDPAAAAAGRRWGSSGRSSHPGGKSWQGFLGGFVVNLAVGVAVPGVGMMAAVAGALGASLAEILPLSIDDNLRTTLGGGAVLWFAAAAPFLGG